MRRGKRIRMLRQAFRVAGADKIMAAYLEVYLCAVLLSQLRQQANPTRGG